MSSTAILSRNRMSYEVSQPVSVKTRPYDTILQYFERQEYKQNDTMIASLSSGKYFLDPEKSYISVNVAIQVAAGQTGVANFSSGSCANLFKNVRIFHKSGTTITSCQDNDINIKARDKIIRDKFWFETIGIQQGYVADSNNDYNITSVVPTGLQYKIKLADLHGFFRGYNSALLPPEIADGLRIELDLNTLGQALKQSDSSDTILSYTIEKPNIQLCLGSIQLPSNVMVDTLKQTYFQALATYNRVRDSGKSAGKFGIETFKDIIATKTTSFSKDQMLALSQLPISSARSLRLNIEYDSAPAEAQICNIFLHYIKVAEVSLTDCKINY